VLLEHVADITRARLQIAQLQRVQNNNSSTSSNNNSATTGITTTKSTSNAQAPLTATSNTDVSYAEYLGPAASLARKSHRQRRATRRLTYNKHGKQHTAGLAMDIDTAVPPANYRAALNTQVVSCT